MPVGQPRAGQNKATIAPAPNLARILLIAARLAELGYTLRSGAAEGADQAFEEGCGTSGGEAEIWLPWGGFNDHTSKLLPTKTHFLLAEQVHPNWNNLTRVPRALHARNVGQVLGANLNTPVAFVLCWTPDGCESETTRSRDTGGTGTAITLASRRNIPVFNLANRDAEERLSRFIKQLRHTQ